MLKILEMVYGRGQLGLRAHRHSGSMPELVFFQPGLHRLEGLVGL